MVKLCNRVKVYHEHFGSFSNDIYCLAYMSVLLGSVYASFDSVSFNIKLYFRFDFTLQGGTIDDNWD